MSTAGRECPYVGLVPFSVDDWPWFFGRDADREIITANLQAAQLTLFYGPSGVGKSSVLRAGVEHHLREQSRREVRTRRRPEFVIVEFSNWAGRPAGGPGPGDPASRGRRAAGPGGSRRLGRPLAGRSAAGWTEHTGADLLLVLDQFEEYFLYHGNEDGEGTFAVEFPRAVNRPDLRANFLISIREDSLAKLDRFQGRIPRLFDNYLRIEHLDRESARQAVVRPLEKFNELRKLAAAEGAERAESSSAVQSQAAGPVSSERATQPPGSGRARLRRGADRSRAGRGGAGRRPDRQGVDWPPRAGRHRRGRIAGGGRATDRSPVPAIGLDPPVGRGAAAGLAPAAARHVHGARRCGKDRPHAPGSANERPVVARQGDRRPGFRSAGHAVRDQDRHDGRRPGQESPRCAGAGDGGPGQAVQQRQPDPAGHRRAGGDDQPRATRSFTTSWPAPCWIGSNGTRNAASCAGSGPACPCWSWRLRLPSSAGSSWTSTIACP